MNFAGLNTYHQRSACRQEDVTRMFKDRIPRNNNAMLL